MLKHREGKLINPATNLNNRSKKEYLLDFVDIQKKVVFEFNGCRYHPCNNCRHLYQEGKDFDFAVQREKEKEKAIDLAKFKLITMKSCEFEQLQKNGAFETEEYQRFLIENQKHTPMTARDGCSGGSVNARVLWMDVEAINKRT